MSEELKLRIDRRKRTLERLFYKWGSVKMSDKRAEKARRKVEQYKSELEALKADPMNIEKYVIKGRWKDVFKHRIS